MTTAQRLCRSLCLLVFMAILATGARANCYRYISYDGTTTKINANCAEQFGITPIFVTNLGAEEYDITIPPMTGTGLSYRSLAPSAIAWLNNPGNMTATTNAIATAVANSGLYPGVSGMGKETKTEYVNYQLSTWLNTSGATSAIAGTQPPQEDWLTCPPMCTSCVWFHNNPFWPMVWCEGQGSDCCVIHKILQTTAE